MSLTDLIKSLEIRRLEAEVKELNHRIEALQKENLYLSISGLKVAQ